MPRNGTSPRGGATRTSSIAAQIRDLIGRIASQALGMPLADSSYHADLCPPASRELLGSDFERLRTLARVSQSVSSSLDTGRVLKAIATAAATLMGAPLAAFWLVDEVTRTIHASAFSDEALAADLLHPTIASARARSGARRWSGDSSTSRTSRQTPTSC